jgi:hypothetical protein
MRRYLRGSVPLSFPWWLNDKKGRRTKSWAALLFIVGIPYVAIADGGVTWQVWVIWGAIVLTPFAIAYNRTVEYRKAHPVPKPPKPPKSMPQPMVMTVTRPKPVAPSFPIDKYTCTADQAEPELRRIARLARAKYGDGTYRWRHEGDGKWVLSFEELTGRKNG